MDFAIIAAGEGSRLAKSGYPYPKPLARLNGIPLIERLIAIFAANGAETIHIIVNEESASLVDFLASYGGKVPIRVVQKSTESSLHSFYELLKDIPTVNELCATTVDTIFREEEFRSYLQAFQGDKKLDALMAVTPFVEDESPLYVEVNETGDVVAFTDTKAGEAGILVSGGIYALRRKALQCVDKAINNKVERMRNYQRLLLTERLSVKAFIFNKIIDIDHLADLHLAEEWLNEEKISQ
ncbi:NDP-sugar synthase [Olivibacter sp. XZL3]|uniref:nucleotidyltransferase family protein n=1 Tax=Olivibacter sp. XZL3 TaxID=1735116 RepID=UPI0010666CAD|nr:NDP-sugar synthase [Olivibacter sp. XZL3]